MKVLGKDLNRLGLDPMFTSSNMIISVPQGQLSR